MIQSRLPLFLSLFAVLALASACKKDNTNQNNPTSADQLQSALNTKPDRAAGTQGAASGGEAAAAGATSTQGATGTQPNMICIPAGSSNCYVVASSNTGCDGKPCGHNPCGGKPCNEGDGAQGDANGGSNNDGDGNVPGKSVGSFKVATFDQDLRRMEDMCPELRLGARSLDINTDWDMDGLSNECEWNLHTNPRCYNGFLVGGVRFHMKTLKSLCRDGTKGLFNGFKCATLFNNKNKVYDQIIDVLTKTGQNDTVNIINRIYEAHDEKYRFTVNSGDTVLSRTAGYFAQQDRSDTDGVNFAAAIVKGGVANPIFNNARDGEPGDISGLATSRNDLKGDGAFMVMAEGYVVRPGRYQLLRGRIAADGQIVQDADDRGSLFLVTIDDKTTIVSSLDKKKGSDPSNAANRGMITIEDRNLGKPIRVAAIVRYDSEKDDGEYIKDGIFMRRRGVNESGEGETAYFLSQDLVQLTVGKEDSTMALQNEFLNSLADLTGLQGERLRDVTGQSDTGTTNYCAEFSGEPGLFSGLVKMDGKTTFDQ